VRRRSSFDSSRTRAASLWSTTRRTVTAPQARIVHRPTSWRFGLSRGRHRAHGLPGGAYSEDRGAVLGVRQVRHDPRQQRGFSPEEVLAGLCDAVARNLRHRSSRVAGCHPGRIRGGVASNAGVLGAVRRAFGLDDGLTVPPITRILPLQVRRFSRWRLSLTTSRCRCRIRADMGRNAQAVHGSRYTPARPNYPRSVARLGERRPVFLGIDVGSVSTNLAVVDNDAEVLWELYVRTRARPSSGS